MMPVIRQERLIGDFTELTTGSAESLDERRVADLLTEKLNLIGFSVSEDDAGQKLGGSDNHNFLKAGIRGIVLSCGMQRVHSTEEYVSVAELVRGAALVAVLIQDRI